MSTTTNRRTARTTNTTGTTRQRSSNRTSSSTTTQPKSTTHQKQRINLIGSTTVVSDYFHYAINCILYQRAIYDQADFKLVKKFGLQMMLVEDQAIENHIRKIIDQVKLWLMEGKLSRLVLVIQRKDDGETIERWEFDVTLEKEEEEEDSSQSNPIKTTQPTTNQSQQEEHQSKQEEKEDKVSTIKKKRNNSLGNKSLNQIQIEIQQIIRQIIATVSFLPIPESTRTFKVLAYTDRVSQEESSEWKDSEAFDITNGAERVQLKSFSTSIHKVDTAVDYKLGESII